jgi:hypothetical protein
MSPVFKQTFSIHPDQNQTLAMIPRHPLVYYWTNTLHLETYLQHALRNPEQRRQLENNLRKQLDITPEQLMKAFGSQWAVILEDIRINGFLPIPKLVLLLEVADQDTVSRLLQTTLQKSEMRYLQESFRGKTIHSAQLPMGIALQPAYTFLNGFCILGSHPDMLKQVLASQEEQVELTAADRFEDVEEGLTEPNNHIAFIRSNKFIEEIQGLMAWGSNMLAMKGNAASRKHRIMMEQIINPILDGFKVYNDIGLRTRFGENTIETLTVYRVKPQPAS